ncbi:hypothetical protein BO70DRAFT_395121 [Aspergillus heteromorphus CBS 117.55]|uniref:Uncharacterized protein n=1 Tax=Aspergillus heteromorphus CBS 117.55 TaxID=1448321 RepID=A0A317WL11_9EURO|nr:uncharacterized protein BO70DRAFT_395121 [Aspergillus heteromorphus CBS 117.55]PWY85992.1 hypothetical protein BO70DRAFT_395121 [Aspergillus heteromorphus CBS 117.55]
MLETLSNLLFDIQYGPHKRKVTEYLRNATQESVLEDLHRALSRRINEIKDPRGVFDAFCVEGSDGWKYWTLQSLTSHIRHNHPSTTFPSSTVSLLWRTFYFHAYHPFPFSFAPTRNETNPTDSDSDSDSRRINEPAFQRAVALLVHRGTELLGTQDEDDYFWRDEGDYSRRVGVRVLRSIGRTGSVSDCSSSGEIGLEKERGRSAEGEGETGVVEDVMDVLATTQPYSVKVAPDGHVLGAVARRLLGSGRGLDLNVPIVPLGCCVTGEDLVALVELVRRVRVWRSDQRSWTCFGAFEEEGQGKRMGTVLGGGLVRNGVYSLSDEHELVLRVQELLPDLELRFHQLWGVLFHPEMLPNDSLTRVAAEHPQASHEE